VRGVLGTATNNRFRLWYTEHATHGGPNTARTVSYQPVLHQALRDLSAWVEKGVAPPESTKYTVVDGQVIIPSTATERRGVQPVVRFTANGGERAEVAVGEPVTFAGVVEVPLGAGKLVSAELDLDGSGKFSQVAALQPISATSAKVSAIHAYAQPGTYFVTLRAAAQREGDPTPRLDASTISTGCGLWLSRLSGSDRHSDWLHCQS
jgi:hypothetical protein